MKFVHYIYLGNNKLNKKTSQITRILQGVAWEASSETPTTQTQH
jgi:hypothetical protein